MCGHMAELESQGSWTSGLVEVPHIIVWNVSPFSVTFFFFLRSMSLFNDYVNGALCTDVGIAGSNTAHLIFL